MGSFEHAQKFPLDKTHRDVRLMYGLYPLAYGLFGTDALHLLYLSSFYLLKSVGIIERHNSCNTDPSAPILPTLFKLERKTLKVGRMTDRLKIVYPSKTPFYGGINGCFQ